MITTIEQMSSKSDVVVVDASEATFVQDAKIMVAKHGWSDKREKDTDFPQWAQDADWCVYGYGGQFTQRGSDLMTLIGKLLHSFIVWTDWASQTLSPQLPAELIDFKSVDESEWPAQYVALAKYVLPRMKELGIAFLTRDEHYGPYRLIAKEDYE